MNWDGCKEIADLADFRRQGCDDSHESSRSFPSRTPSDRPRGTLTRSHSINHNSGEDLAIADDRWDADIEPLWIDCSSSSSDWPDASVTGVKRFISSQDTDKLCENGGAMLKAAQWPDAQQRCSKLEQQQQLACRMGPTETSAAGVAAAAVCNCSGIPAATITAPTAGGDSAAARSKASECSLSTASLATAAAASDGYDSDGSSAVSAATAAAVIPGSPGSPPERSASSAGFASTPLSSDPSYLTARRLSSSSADGSGQASPAYHSRKSQPPATTVTAAATSRKSDTPARERRRTWFSGSYKQRSDEFKKIFKDVPSEERLLVDYSCAMQKELLVHGRLYVSQNWICFYANIFRWETTVAIQLREVSAITKERTAKFIPTLQISTAKEKLVFTSFASRDKSYLMVFKAWQNAITGQPLSSQELNTWISHLYGSWPDIASSDAEEVDALSASVTADSIGAEAASLDHMGPLAKDASPSSEGERRSAMVSSCSADCVEQLYRVPTTSAATAIGTIVHSASTGAALSAAVGLTVLSRETAASEPSLLRTGTLQRPGGQRLGSSGQSTDGSDTTEDDACEAEPAVVEESESAALSMVISCSWHKHTGRTMIDDEYNISAQEMFTMLFSDSDFMKRFLTARKTTDVVVTPWPDECDSTGNKQRTNTYTIALNAPIGPKSTPATEIQTMYKECVADSYYCVDCKCLNSPDLPYGENFYVLNKYCIMRLSKNQSRLVVHSETVYLKSVFIFVRGIIDKNVSNGVTSYFVPLKQALREESDRRKRTVPVVAPKKTVRRRRRTSTPPGGAPAAATPVRKTSVPTAGRSTYVIAKPETGQQPAQQPTTVGRHTELLTFAILLFLIAFNAFLFYKLWLLEASVLKTEQPTCDYLSHPTSRCELSPHELLRSLQQQRDAHSHEVERWQLLLEASGKYIDELKSTIESLKASVKESGSSSMSSVVGSSVNAPT